MGGLDDAQGARRAGDARCAALVLALAVAAPALRADSVLYIGRGSEWSYFLGLEEPSSPIDAWRFPGFDAGSWGAGAAPFGYGDLPLGTDISLLSPPMRGNYSSVFLRQTFEVVDAGAVSRLEVEVNYDDGFVLWINGVEVLRRNMPGSPGGVVFHDDFAIQAFKSGAYEAYSLPEPRDYLADGTNVVAAAVFNNQVNSSDLKFDLELYDPEGPDLAPPRVLVLAPPAGATVRFLDSIEVTFDEPVAGVGAGDLLVSEVPASLVSGSGAGPYRFQFAAQAPGSVAVRWADAHGISDLASPPNAFAGGAWTYSVDPKAPAADLAISEFLAITRGGILDEDGETSEWLEIENRGTEATDAGGLSLSDDPDRPEKWVLPSRVIPAGGHLLVFASGKDRRPASGPIHTNFRIEGGGEFLGLFSSDSPRRALFAYAPEFPPQRAGVSYGLDGAGNEVYFETPTPGAVNDTRSARSGIVADPELSLPRGFWSEPFDLEITTLTSGASIRYTLDGSEPSPSRGAIYSGPLRIAGDAQRAVQTVRAIAYRSGFLPSRAVTHTYIFPEHVLFQPPAPPGFPPAWNGVMVDYEMDPQITNDPTSRDRILDGLLSIPTISIVSDMESIFGATGIYSNPTGEGDAWERACSAEIFYPPGFEPPEGDRSGRQINCGVRIQGGASRNPPRSPKHSFRLLFKGIYGETKLRMRFFPYETATTRFDTITLRAGYNNSWIHSDAGQRSRAQYIRDQWVRDALLEMGHISSHGIFVNLYVNGLYWGLYNAVERPSAPFAASYGGGEKEEYDALNSAVAVDGDTRAWATVQSLAEGDVSSLAGYERVLQYLDADNLIDYMTANIFGANQDWDHHNWYAARRRAPGEPWRFFSWDAERIFEDVGANAVLENNNNQPSELYTRLRENAEFRLRFADRLHRHFFNGGTLTPGRVSELWMCRANEIASAVVAESARWGDYRQPSSPYTQEGHWFPEQDRLLKSYFPQRSSRVLSQFRGIGLYPSAGAPVLSRHGGPVERGFSVTLQLPAGTSGTIYYTTSGADPRQYGSGDVSEEAVAYSEPVRIDGATLLKARVLSGATWSALTEALFTVPDLYRGLRISELMYHAPGGSRFDFVEVQNTGIFPVPLRGLHFSDGIEYAFPAGAVLGPGEFAVVAEDPASFEIAHPGVPAGGPYAGSLSNAGERLTIRDAFGASVLSFEYDDERLWPVAPDGFGFSLVLADPGGLPDDPASWRASAALHGSPGREDGEPPHGGIVLHEVLARSTAPLEDAIELHNPTAAPIELGGWYLSDDRSSHGSLLKFRIPDGTSVPPGGFAVFYERDFNPRPGAFPSFALDGAGEEVYLTSADANGDITGAIVGFEFDALPDGVSYGRVLTTAGPDNAPLLERTFGVSEPASVEEFRLGTGEENTGPRYGPVIFHELHYHPADGGDEFIEILNVTQDPVALQGTDSLGGAVEHGWRIRGIQNADMSGSYEFPPGARLGPNGIALVVRTTPAAFRARYGVPAGVPVFGPYGGALDGDGEELRLLRPAPGDAGEEAFELSDRVAYDDRLPWPEAANGRGPSLERRLAVDYGNEPRNWGASVPAGGTPGRANSVGPPLPNQPPIAIFDAAPDGGEAPLDVLFDAALAEDPDGRIAAYEWDFGDGESGEGMSVLHTYTVPGTYRPTLLVRDDEGAEASAARTVTVWEPLPNRTPVAAFTAEPPGGPAPLDVRFDASASRDDDGAIASYSWSFGDGEAGSGRTVTHQFTRVGVYDIRLTVRDDEGAEDTATARVTVVEDGQNAPPVASFIANPEKGPPPLQVIFDASASTDPDGTITEYTWDFGDGATGSGRLALHTFGSAGDYEVVLTVLDDRGAESAARRTLRVIEQDTRGFRLPGDCNQDGGLDISDGICILGFLFLGSPRELPCGDGTASDRGNQALLNVNGSAGIDLADAVYLLTYLFQGGLPPVAGTRCVGMESCSERCTP